MLNQIHVQLYVQCIIMSLTESSMYRTPPVTCRFDPYNHVSTCVTARVHLISHQHDGDVMVRVLDSFDLLADLGHGDEGGALNQRVHQQEAFSVAHVTVTHSTEHFLQTRGEGGGGGGGGVGKGL